MSIYCLCTGGLFRDPEARVGRSGKSYATAAIISKDGDTSTFVSVIAFSASAQEVLMALRAGDALSVQGKATIGVYEKNGEPHPSLSIVVDQVLALRQPPKERKAAQRDVPSRGGAAPFDDAIPFGVP